jgi:hypothetical protein
MEIEVQQQKKKPKRNLQNDNTARLKKENVMNTNNTNADRINATYGPLNVICF